MADRPRALHFSLWLCVGVGVEFALAGVSPALPADPPSQKAVVTPSGSTQPVEITADRIEYFKVTEVYEAEGSVIITQGPIRLTSDRATLMTLTGTLIATGHVHLKDATAEMNAERMELNVNTEAGVVTHGQLYINRSNSLVTGRLLQRFSEDHYRVKEGSFTNCDAREGQVPAWRFTFKDADVEAGRSAYLKDAWLCVNDVPIFPILTFSYPLATERKSGLLIPTPGYDNRFGLTYRQGIYWVISPSQDLTVSPQYFSDLGYLSDVEYRYVLGRRTKGQWLLSALKQEKLPKVQGVDPASADVKRTRGMVSGTHTQQELGSDFRMMAQALLVTDPQYLSQLSNSGAQRALPSGDNNLLMTQRFTSGNVYLLGQYLQPLTAGGKETFQRLPELGHTFINYAPLGGPLLVGMDSKAAYFTRERGFEVARVDLLPSLTMDMINMGHVVGFTPQVKFRETFYTHGVDSAKSTDRQTFWASVEGASRLARRFDLEDGRSFFHTIEPKVVYEFVPATDQSNIVQIDDTDNLLKKNLVTYSVQSRLLTAGAGAASSNWMDLTVAQSYHVGSEQSEARSFVFPGSPAFGLATQPAQPQMVPVQGRKFSDVWLRAMIGSPTRLVMPGVLGMQRIKRPVFSNSLTMDAFFDPYTGAFSQWNTDFRFQSQQQWYVEVGQRYTRPGNRVRRGDIWNPISFGEVFAPTPELNFATLTAATRLPFGWTVGAKAYYDLKNGTSPELDVVGLYQNPCKCWSLGLYFLQFPDRQQYNVMFSLTGIGWTENFGTAVMKAILSPLLWGERGLPWAMPGGHYGIPTDSGSNGGAAVTP